MLDRQQLRTLRHKRRLTQQRLAEAIGVYQPDISNLERGVHTDVSTARLAALAAALGVRMEQLVSSPVSLVPCKGHRTRDHGQEGGARGQS